MNTDHQGQNQSGQNQSQENQGEGNREAAREYNEATREHVRSNDVEEEARQAGDQDPNEAASSEAEGRARAKEEDPEVTRNFTQPSER